ncbi:MAG: lasso peptide biosynthesis B2 protein [Actinobacteria bacterium]|nr:lasso peptide biosynthesis B2 protein [Actinomycetota bacterium]
MEQTGRMRNILMSKNKMGRFEKLKNLSGVEVMALIKILVLALTVPPARKVMRIETIVRILTYRTKASRSPLDEKMIVRLIDAVLSRLRGPWAKNCVTRSIILCRLLKEAGIDSSIHIGVCEYQDTYRGHAWVESHGLPIGEPQDTKVYGLHSYPTNSEV